MAQGGAVVGAGCETQLALSGRNRAAAEQHVYLEEAREPSPERLRPAFPGFLNEEESVDGEKRQNRGRGRLTCGAVENDVPEFGPAAHRPLQRRQEARVHRGIPGPGERMPLAQVAL